MLESSNKVGILPLTDEAFDALLEKYVKASKWYNNILIEEEVWNVHPVMYNIIDSEMVRDGIKKTSGSADPSDLHTEDWHWILISWNFWGSAEFFF